MNLTHRPRRQRIAATAGLAVLLLVGMDTYTYAATGDSLVLGKYNKAYKTTHLTSTGNGPALSLHAKGNRAPLAVDSTATVVRLNADRVDGKNATDLQNTVRVYTATSGSAPGGALQFDLPRLASGSYLATYDVFLFGAHGTVANPTTARCNFITGDSRFVGYSSTLAVGGFSAGLAGAGVIATKGERWRLACDAVQHGVGTDDWSILSGAPIQVTLTRIDRRLSGSLPVAK